MPSTRRKVMTAVDLEKKTACISTILKKTYPDARCMLDFRNPYELLVATILAAQCTDKKVNEVTAALFRKYDTPGKLSRAGLPQLEREIRPTGFFRRKARSITGCCRMIVGEHSGSVPDTMEELTRLPGVGRKTARVVLGECFGKPGIIVDTHCKRVSTRLGLTTNTDPDKIEADLDDLVPLRERNVFSHLLTFHGRFQCPARKPRCEKCPVRDLCNFAATQARSSV